MTASLQALVPIFAYFAIGLLLRRLRIATPEQAQFVFRFVFFVTLPPLAFHAIAGTDLGAGSAALPVTGFVVNLVCASLAFAYARVTHRDRETTGTIVIGASVANTVFVFPFVLAALGRDALADAVLYDIGNAIFVATLTYAVALRYGSGKGLTIAASLLRILRSPLFIAVILAVTFSVAGWQVPALIDAVLEPLGAATVPLVLIALGISFSMARLRDAVVYSTVLIRMGAGLAVGWLLIGLFGLEGTTAVAVLACAAAPVGFNAVTFTALGELDVEHATATLSVSVAIGLVSVAAIVMAA